MSIKVHDFYRENSLRLIEIKRGVKGPTTHGWPKLNRSPDYIQALLDSPHSSFDKYGFVLDDCHVVVDIDKHVDKANGFESLEKLEANLGFTLESVCGAIVETPSGGRHYYFTKDEATTFSKVFSGKYPGIDFINGSGKQVVAANSPHPDSPGFYEFSKCESLEPLPEAVIEHLVELKTVKVPKGEFVSVNHDSSSKLFCERSGDEFNRSPRGLDILLAEMQASGYVVRPNKDFYEFDRPGKTTTSKCSGYVGQKSKNGNYQLVCFSLSDDVFPTAESMTIFHAYALLVAKGDHTAAADSLYRLNFAESEKKPILETIDWDQLLRSFDPDTSELEVGKRVLDPGTFPDDCLLPRGFIGEVAKFTLETSDEPQPILALAGAMSLLSVLTGRKICNERDNRTNLFVLGLGPSGCGKDRPRKVNTEILNRIGKPEFIGPVSLGSGHGIESQLKLHPSKLFQLDEIGDLLKAIKKERGSGHMEAILQKIKMLMTSSHSLYSNSATSDAKSYFTIDQPHMVIFGTATPEKFWDNLSVDSIEDGFLGRILPLEVHGYGETQDPALAEIPVSILEQAKAWGEFEPTQGNLGGMSPKPAVYRLADDAKLRHMSYCKNIDSKIPKDGTHKATDGLWKRARGRAASLALLFAASRLGPRLDGVIELIDVEMAIKVINWITRRTIFKVTTQVSENQFERDCNRVLEAIRKQACDSTQLTRRTRWLKSRERNEILENLRDRGEIEVVKESTKTNTRTVYRICG